LAQDARGAFLAPGLMGAALLGMGLATGNTTASAMGAAALASSAIKALTAPGSNGQPPLISTASGFGKIFGGIGAALPGVGLAVSGGMQGGIGGTLETGVGGAMAGFEIGAAIGSGLGPLGALAGAGAGLIGGLISSLIGGQSYMSKVKSAIKKHNYIRPPGETFSFAMGDSIAQTLGTGFAQSGNHFSTFGLPAGTPFTASALTGTLTAADLRLLAQESLGIIPTQPFLGFPKTDPFIGQGPLGHKAAGAAPTSVTFNIHAIDAQGVRDFLHRNGEAIAQVVGSKVTSSSSGFGYNVRRAAFPP
jgi:hypothetical protein